MTARIHRIIVGADDAIGSGIHTVSVDVVCTRIQVAFNDETQPHLGKDVVAGLELAILRIGWLFLKRLSNCPHGKNITLGRQCANDLSDEVVPCWIVGGAKAGNLWNVTDLGRHAQRLVVANIVFDRFRNGARIHS